MDGRIRVRRQQREAYNEDCTVPRVQAGGGGVIIWGAFHHGGKCDLDQYRYLHIMEEQLLPFARLTFGHNVCTRMTTPGLRELAQWSISWKLK